MAVVMGIIKRMMGVNGHSGSPGADGDSDGCSHGDGIVLMMVMVVLEMMLTVAAAMIIVEGW